MKSPAQIGPDLSNAVEDVQSRFGRTLDDFLREPTGTMAVVLSRQIVLTPEEKPSRSEKIREAFAEYQKQKAKSEGEESPPPRSLHPMSKEEGMIIETEGVDALVEWPSRSLRRSLAGHCAPRRRRARRRARGVRRGRSRR